LQKRLLQTRSSAALLNSFAVLHGRLEEQTDLLALILVGRGDYDAVEWDDAIAEAESRIAARDPDYMIGDAALPEYLGVGLEALGRACD